MMKNKRLMFSMSLFLLLFAFVAYNFLRIDSQEGERAIAKIHSSVSRILTEELNTLFLSANAYSKGEKSLTDQSDLYETLDHTYNIVNQTQSIIESLSSFDYRIDITLEFTNRYLSEMRNLASHNKLTETDLVNLKSLNKGYFYESTNEFYKKNGLGGSAPDRTFLQPYYDLEEKTYNYLYGDK